jgi:hypothetical protein
MKWKFGIYIAMKNKIKDKPLNLNSPCLNKVKILVSQFSHVFWGILSK